MAAHGVQGRGVMIDLRVHFGDDHRRIGYDDLVAVLQADRVTISPAIWCASIPASRNACSK